MNTAWPASAFSSLTSAMKGYRGMESDAKYSGTHCRNTSRASA